MAKNTIDLDAERILVSALRGMSGLTSFKWTRTPPLINPNQEADIWITLANYCPSLNSLHVLDREKPYEPVLEEIDDPAYQRPSRNPNVRCINSIPNITSNIASVLFVQRFEVIFVQDRGSLARC